MAACAVPAGWQRCPALFTPDIPPLLRAGGTGALTGPPQPTPPLSPHPPVPKVGDPQVATFPCLDNPFILQLCKCLRTGKSTATLHDLSK